MTIRSFLAKGLRGLTALAIALPCVAAAGAAEARLFADQIPPTLCKSARVAGSGDRTEYEGTKIGVRSSSSIWDYDFVMCPINRFNPGDQVREIRLFTEGDRATNGWCQLYEAPNSDNAAAFQYPVSAGTNRGKVVFDPPSANAEDGLVALTARCLLFPGNSITGIEIIWDR